jgi:hypothetical protein
LYVVIATSAVVKTARIQEKHHTRVKADRLCVVLAIQSPASMIKKNRIRYFVFDLRGFASTEEKVGTGGTVGRVQAAIVWIYPGSFSIGPF